MSFNLLKVTAFAGALAAALAGVTDYAQHAVVSKHVPPIVQNGRAKYIAPMAGSETLHLTLALPLRNEDQLDALLADLYNPKSPNFHKWLSQADFESRFGALKTDFKTLRNWATAKGLTVTYQAENNRLIEVDGTVDAVNKAFNVEERKYHDTYLDRDFHAPDREPTTDLPFALLDVEGIENSAPIVNHLKKDPSAGIPSLLKAPGTESGVVSAAAKQGPKPNVYGSGPANSYLPSDMRAAYYGNGNLTGAGQTVGIFSFDGYLTADLQIYYANTGMTSTIPITNVVASGTGACTATCEDDEQILDIVQVEGMAPGLSSILFYEGTSASTELNKMATDNLAKTISCSWGGGGFGTSSDTYFKQMATQGQSFLSATGDDGGLFKSNYSAPSFDPYITQVGGTDLYTTGPGGAWSSEISWADSGGGYWLTGMSTSAKYTIPTWQTVNGANGASTLYRNVPDIAAEANFDNPTANNGAFEIGYGGTSYAAPRMAGLIALANQQAVANGQTTLGFLNPALYTAGLGSSSASLFHDITVGSNPSYPTGGPTYTAGTGYDLVTGLGSPIGPALINTLAGSAVADFGLPSTATISVVRNTGFAAANYLSIPITAYNGYSGTVQLSSLTGLPSTWGDGTLPGTPSSPFQIAFSVPNTATPGTYSMTLTLVDANNSALTHTVPLLVTVEKRANGDFSIQQNATATVAAGGSVNTTVLVTPGAGLPDVVNLSVSGVPPGVTASFFNPVVQPQKVTNALLVVTAASYATPNTYNLTVTGSDAQGIVHTAIVPLTVTTPVNLLQNGGFESGVASPWTFTTVSGTSAVQLLTISSTLPAHLGNYFALLEGGSSAGVDTMAQTVRIPYGSSKATLNLWYWILTGQTGTTPVDTMTVQIIDTSNNNAVTTLGTLSNLNAADYYSNLSYDVTQFIGHKVIVQITANQAGATYTDFLVDDVAINVY